MLSLSTMAFAADTISDWAKDNVNKAAELGIIPASLSDGGDYTMNITRVQFAEAIYKLFKFTNKVSQSTVDTPFSDINNGAITSLYLDGIVNGKGDNKFAPDDSLTREEASTIFGRAINKYCPDTNITTDNDSLFGDDTKLASWSRDYVYSMKNLGIIEGFEDGDFRPASNMSKEEALTIIIRTKDKLGIKVAALSVPVIINEDDSAIEDIINSLQTLLDEEEIIPDYEEALEAQGAEREETPEGTVYTVDEDGIRHEPDGTPVFEDVLKRGEELDAQMPSLEEVLRNAELEN